MPASLQWNSWESMRERGVEGKGKAPWLLEMGTDATVCWVWSESVSGDMTVLNNI